MKSQNYKFQPKADPSWTEKVKNTCLYLDSSFVIPVKTGIQNTWIPDQLIIFFIGIVRDDNGGSL